MPDSLRRLFVYTKIKALIEQVARLKENSWGVSLFEAEVSQVGKSLSLLIRLAIHARTIGREWAKETEEEIIQTVCYGSQW